MRVPIFTEAMSYDNFWDSWGPHGAPAGYRLESIGLETVFVRYSPKTPVYFGWHEAYPTEPRFSGGDPHLYPDDTARFYLTLGGVNRANALATVDEHGQRYNRIRFLRGTLADVLERWPGAVLEFDRSILGGEAFPFPSVTVQPGKMAPVRGWRPVPGGVLSDHGAGWHSFDDAIFPALLRDPLVADNWDEVDYFDPDVILRTRTAPTWRRVAVPGQPGGQAGAGPGGPAGPGPGNAAYPSTRRRR